MDTTNVEAPIVTEEGGLIVREWPAADLVAVDDFRITRLAFVDRFTDAEAVAIDLASMGATVQAASIRRYLDKVNKAAFIDLSREDTQVGVQALETNGLLSAGRADAILTAPIQPHERPQ